MPRQCGTPARRLQGAGQFCRRCNLQTKREPTTTVFLGLEQLTSISLPPSTKKQVFAIMCTKEYEFPLLHRGNVPNDDVFDACGRNENKPMFDVADNQGGLTQAQTFRTTFGPVFPFANVSSSRAAVIAGSGKASGASNRLSFQKKSRLEISAETICWILSAQHFAAGRTSSLPTSTFDPAISLCKPIVLLLAS